MKDFRTPAVSTIETEHGSLHDHELNIDFLRGNHQRTEKEVSQNHLGKSTTVAHEQRSKQKTRLVSGFRVLHLYPEEIPLSWGSVRRAWLIQNEIPSQEIAQ